MTYRTRARIFCAVQDRMSVAAFGESFIAHSGVMFVVLYGNEKIAVGIRGKENCATTGERKKDRS